MKAFTAILALFFASLVAPSTLAHPIHAARLPILKIEESTIAVPLVHQLEEETRFAVNSSQSGFAIASETAIRVQRGTSGTLMFNISVSGVQSDMLSSLDKEFVESLTRIEREEYESFVEEFNGGLNIPFLRWLGIDLRNNEVTQEQMESIFEVRENYNIQSDIAAQLLDNVQRQQVQVSGTLTATGVSFIPTTVNALIRIAQITLQDGSTLNVVSQDTNDVIAADPNGRIVPSSNMVVNFL